MPKSNSGEIPFVECPCGIRVPLPPPKEVKILPVEQEVKTSHVERITAAREELVRVRDFCSGALGTLLSLEEQARLAQEREKEQAPSSYQLADLLWHHLRHSGHKINPALLLHCLEKAQAGRKPGDI